MGWTSLSRCRRSSPRWTKLELLIVSDHIEHHLEEMIGPLPSAVRSDLAKLGDLAKYL